MSYEKLSAAHSRIGFAFGQGHKPVLMCSFGKDSLVMLDLLAKHGLRDVLYVENIDEIVDWPYIWTIVDRYNLNLQVLPKGRGVLFFVKGSAQFMSFPFVNQTTMLPVPMGLTPWQGRGEFMCVDDELRADLGTTVDHDYNVFFFGSKAVDLDTGLACLPWMEKLTPEEKEFLIVTKGVHKPIVRPTDGTTFAFPIFDWSQDEVWDYVESQKLPVSAKVYDGRKRRLHENIACYRCHDPSLPARVFCPKVGRDITNLGHFTQEGDLGLVRMQRLGVIPAETAKALNG